jgi:hypothetical protein
MDDGELHEEDDGGGLHSPGGVAYRWLGLQVVATRRRVGEALLVGSTVEEMDGWWRSLTNRGGGKEQSDNECGAEVVEAKGGNLSPTCAFYSRASRWTPRK